MRTIPTIGILVIVLAFVTPAFSTDADEKRNQDVEEILRLHNELIEAHKVGDVDKLLAPEPEQIITVNRGEVLFENKSERIPQFKQYLEDTEFSAYRDLIDPLVRVSKDGTLGWLIAQVKIAGTRTYDVGESKSFDNVWAWIELYEKKNGRWYRIGDVSNVKPETED